MQFNLFFLFGTKSFVVVVVVVVVKFSIVCQCLIETQNVTFIIVLKEIAGLMLRMIVIERIRDI